jgi:hypothetical protein
MSSARIGTVAAINPIGLPKNLGSLELARATWLDSYASNSTTLEKGLVKEYKPHMPHSFGVICRPLPEAKKEFCFEGWIRSLSLSYPTLDLEGAGIRLVAPRGDPRPADELPHRAEPD